MNTGDIESVKSQLLLTIRELFPLFPLSAYLNSEKNPVSATQAIDSANQAIEALMKRKSIEQREYLKAAYYLLRGVTKEVLAGYPILELTADDFYFVGISLFPEIVLTLTQRVYGESDSV